MEKYQIVIIRTREKLYVEKKSASVIPSKREKERERNKIKVVRESWNLPPTKPAVRESWNLPPNQSQNDSMSKHPTNANQ